MNRMSLFMIGIIVAVIGIASVSAYSYTANRIPSEDELPSQKILNNQLELEEVKTFMQKYPNAEIIVDRSGRLAIDYRVDEPLQNSNNGTDARTLRLRVFSDNQGLPQEIYIDCADGKNSHLTYDNITEYIKTEKCLSS